MERWNRGAAIETIMDFACLMIRNDLNGTGRGKYSKR
jgi:hypothetical protein